MYISSFCMSPMQKYTHLALHLFYFFVVQLSCKFHNHISSTHVLLTFG